MKICLSQVLIIHKMICQKMMINNWAAMTEGRFIFL